MSLTYHRRLRIAAGTALLTLAVTGCSVLGRTAVGPVTYTSGDASHVQVNSPPVRGCHRLAAGGARMVTNLTLVDLKLYPKGDCKGKYTYLGTTLSNETAPGAGPWQSYGIVH